MPKVIDCFQQRYPRVNVHIVEGQLSSMLPALRQDISDFTINTVTQLPFERELSFEPLRLSTTLLWFDKVIRCITLSTFANSARLSGPCLPPPVAIIRC
ncbi:hypothetical protein [Rosenbergiella metrosideri]|uniref:hypothetical protein n=1 Tax=Rosenbergiella metrosideri TaxID=2921185 RepID=UPI001F4F3B47|nr:hypothetical protein [Rosenbergiella metrosideri]